ncbi:hypothetical protein FSP39_015207 [Pinctada imbricata]|uniref:Fibrinogen C-terminal domain-containing protein n=1 Tax=Pinctada imbricata TaxID=66713 RepID=A0AA88XJ31_PINIB|nr:hypothetical protein FSP39_015207 [Pinctada imbricata]
MPEGVSSCPNSIHDTQNDVHSNRLTPAVPQLFRQSSTKGIQDLVDRLSLVEQHLDDEVLKNDFLNKTISKQEQTLQRADKLLQECRGNFSKIFRLMNHLERTIQSQKTEYRQLDKKVSSVVLDVVEVNNVLAKKTVPIDGNTSTSKKEILVESAAKIQGCGLTNPDAIFRDCQDLYDKGHIVSGVYFITPLYSACSIPVWCEMETTPGGWLVIQSRKNGELDFNRFWQSYKEGFGNIASEFWLGLDNIFLLTNQDHYELRVDLWDFNDNRVHALYKNFKIDGERDKYRIHLHDYEGSIRNGLAKHNGMMFSTPDQDNDKWPNYHCGREWQAGWWFNNCWFAFLNGPYYNNTRIQYRGISWNDWKPEQLARTKMMIRPSRLHVNKKAPPTPPDTKDITPKPKN